MYYLGANTCHLPGATIERGELFCELSLVVAAELAPDWAPMLHDDGVGGHSPLTTAI